MQAYGSSDMGATHAMVSGDGGGAGYGTAPPGASLRGWLDYLERRDRLEVARPGLALRYRVAALANRLEGERATLFPAPDGHAVPVIAGLLSDRRWIADAMGVSTDRVIERYQEACARPLAWEETTAAACQQRVHHSVDLPRQLPIPTHNEHDHGAYITAGLLIARQPRTGKQNVSIHRLQVSGPDRLGALLLPRHTRALFAEQEAGGQDLSVAIVIGADPLTMLASQAIVPLGQDELEIAGALHGVPLPVTRCVSNDVRVPADAEIVIEGRILADQREPEGPFGEFPQYYGERAARHVIEVDAVTHRDEPMFHTIVGGRSEHLLLGAIPREASILAHLQRTFPCVRDVHLPRGGTCRYHLYVQISGHAQGEARNVILGAMATHADIKHVVVVDEDVDVHDPTEVEWAVATRFQADDDLIVVRGAQGSKLDPSTDSGVGAKTGMDATIPSGADEMTYTRIRVPGEQELDLDDVLTVDSRPWRELRSDEAR